MNDERKQHLRDMVQQGERDGLYRNEQASVQPPTREQIADLIPLSLLDGRDPRNNVFEVADQILALFPQPTPMQECGVCGRHYPAADTRSTCPVCWPGFGEYGQQPAPSAEPSVQVPLALMHELRDSVGYLGGPAVAVQPALAAGRAVAAVLAQPTPPAEPVSIADMAPGNPAYVHLNTNAHCACPACERARDVPPPSATQEEGDRG